MRPINLSTRVFSRALWSVMLDHSAYRLEQRRGTFFSRLAELDALRAQADYNTGSVSAATAWALYSVAHYFCPLQMVEVGTFIGRSAMALAHGVEDAGGVAELHTCDLSNDIVIPLEGSTSLIQYPKATSTAMLESMHESGATWSLDLVHLDGRLQPNDLHILAAMCSKDVIIVLDDFEGMEKGVANYQAIRASGWLKSHLLVYPPESEALERRGFSDACVTALMVPVSQVRFTSQ